MAVDARQQFEKLLETEVWFDRKTESIRYTPDLPSGAASRKTASQEGVSDADSDLVRMKFLEAFQQVVDCALRPSTKARTAVSESAVGNSVLASFIEGKLAKVDLSDPENVWSILASAALRHCEKYIRRGTRHPNVSLEPNNDDSSAVKPQVADDRELLPPDLAMIAECVSLIRKVGVPSDALSEIEFALSQFGQMRQVGLELVSSLTELECKVFALRLCKWTFQRIATTLGVHSERVRIAWESIKNKAARLGTV